MQKNFLEKTKLEINHELVASTGHLKPETLKALTNKTVFKNCNYYIYEYGIRFFLCPTQKDPKNMVPKEAQGLARLARKHKCSWLVFDRDGPLYSQFQAFHYD